MSLNCCRCGKVTECHVYGFSRWICPPCYRSIMKPPEAVPISLPPAIGIPPCPPYGCAKCLGCGTVFASGAPHVCATATVTTTRPTRTVKRRETKDGPEVEVKEALCGRCIRWTPTSEAQCQHGTHGWDPEGEKR